MKKNVHLLGIGGSAMSNLALMFQEVGWCVTGTDQKVYPPASLVLAEHGITYNQGYQAGNIGSDIDHVIVGNVISKDNEELRACLAKDLPLMSMPKALFEHFMKNKHRIAVCGTHGKTTTTSLLAWIFQSSQKHPSFFVGGVPVNFQEGYQLSEGQAFIIEGDEYDTAYFEKTPKFLHYHPNHVIITSVEFDHADIYKDLDHVKAQFQTLIDQDPSGRTYFVCTDSDHAVSLEIPKDARVTYGHQDATWTINNVQALEKGQTFDVCRDEKVMGTIQTKLLGAHNRLNVLAATVVSLENNISFDQIRNAVGSFEGVAKRQDDRGEHGGVAVYLDFAHHPTAVQTTIEGFLGVAKARGGRLIVALEPRSNTMRRKIFQQALVNSLQKAHGVVLASVFQKKDNLSVEEQLDPKQLAQALQDLGVKTQACQDKDELIDACVNMVKPKDVLVMMSNGDFQGALPDILCRLDG